MTRVGHMPSAFRPTSAWMARKLPRATTSSRPALLEELCSPTTMERLGSGSSTSPPMATCTVGPAMHSFPHFQVNVPVTLGQWHNLAVVADFATSTYSFFVDDQYLGTFPFPAQDCGACYTTVLLRGSLLASAGPDTATIKKANYAAHYDNFTIQAATASVASE